ncbi:MAG: iron-sulfur cluster-binding oxidoreductase [Geobacteraceae bacterium]|nr:iron-sulfur cluster-binding oxidoreductase [Geobacteraceae bacterium]
MHKLACGCPGSQVRTLNSNPTPRGTDAEAQRESQLRQWPTQLHLVPANAPYLQDAHLLLAADCVPFAYADFHRDFIQGRVVLNACPKLDDTSPYVEKLTRMVRDNNIQSITVAIMEVPCCRGMAMFARKALEQAGRDIPLEVVIIGVNGERRSA